jgi:hypothetical protein
MSYRRVGDPVLCLAFRSSLADPATNWYDALPSGSITSFKHLCTDFCANFAIGVPRIEDSCHLLALRQQPGEKLEAFMNRFLTEKHRSRRPDPGVERAALIAGTFDTDVRKEFLRNPPATFSDACTVINKQIRVERGILGDPPPTQTSQSRPKTDRVTAPETRETRQQKQRAERDDFPRYRQHTPLNTFPADIMTVMSDKKILPRPPAMYSTEITRNSGRYCDYHQHQGHDTNNCRDLRNAIEDALKRGNLREFVLHPRRKRNPSPDDHPAQRQKTQHNNEMPPQPEAERDYQPPDRGVHMIFGGPSHPTSATGKRKEADRGIYHLVDRRPRRYDLSNEDMIFRRSDPDRERLPRDEAMVITLAIANTFVSRLLIDTGSSVVVLMFVAFT